jgi:DMSO/TMAO reductase YedYZ molybdopterin-dependent catalytic subunit
MKTRRQMLKVCATLFGLCLTPISSIVKWAWCATKKTVLPRNTPRESLINKNPADLDTRNLEITPLEEFRTMGLDDHKEDVDSWRLEVTGHVANPKAFSYQEIVALPSIERNVLLICPGVFVNHGKWKGISAKALLDKAGWREDTTHLTFRGPKSRYESLQRYPIADIVSDRVFLAYQVNGQPLPEKHGFPLRVVAEGYYGYDWVKYVCSVTAEKISTESG